MISSQVRMMDSINEVLPVPEWTVSTMYHKSFVTLTCLSSDKNLQSPQLLPSLREWAPVRHSYARHDELRHFLRLRGLSLALSLSFAELEYLARGIIEQRITVREL